MQNRLGGAGLPDLGAYITTEATIPKYDKTNPKHWVPNGQKTTTLALVGMHVVGSVLGHQEMIWSTFEHVNNAPNASYIYVDKATETEGGAVRFQWVMAVLRRRRHERLQHAATFASGADIVSVGSNNIGPSNAVRYMPWGASNDNSPNPKDYSSAVSNSEIISVNASVHAQLMVGDIRRNYVLNGATWTLGGAPYTGNYGKVANPFLSPGAGVGTSQLANMTMETFQTTASSFDAESNNCMNCHLSAANGTDLSHVFSVLKKLF